MSFASLGLSAPILDAISEQGYASPSPIQLQAIPVVLEGKDVMAAAQTGTGKTAAFTLPILERLSKGDRARSNQARALILTPTRELAAQVGECVSIYSSKLPLRSTVVFGGVKINPQMMRLRRGVDVIVATPGRLLDLYNQNAVRFQDLEVLVLDEADRMLDMGFIHDIRKILDILPKRRQNLMFSATFSNDIRKLAKELVNNPVEISVSPPNTTAKTVKQWIHPVDKKQKSALLTQLIRDNNWDQALVFSRTKHGANRLTRQLCAKGINAAAIHGDKSQNARTKALADFKTGSVQILVATDIAARGIDIDQLPQVVNFDLPQVAEDYVHRIGRTGRAGAEGQAVSLVSADEFKLLADIERLIQKRLPREEIEGFEPEQRLPESRLPTQPVKARKPKKPKAAKSGEQREQDRKGEKKGPRQDGAARNNANAPRRQRRRGTGAGRPAPRKEAKSN
ncbi:Superfamily II DNA and RNA helicase [Hahella chejuensis KCTC 2396]|uniref:ATP-dependent RNA helicase RhlE n=1 Tax=Hahella chejuensis (strain KCTC 2396) TaxID=349521 RepID=Q2SD71_HAHCH|nr:DEAD/DEAH box helicase [Hahella chejuensis]ABC31403.1 Superfamily II DNA and RNA helicase [Hahella chejuensis KCTC 2396]